MCEVILYGKRVCHECIEGVKTVCVCSAAISSIASGKTEKPDYPVKEA